MTQSPIDRPCPVCGAQPNQKCRRRKPRESLPWSGDELTIYHAGRYPHTRLAMSKAGLVHIRDPKDYLRSIHHTKVSPANVSSHIFVSCRVCRIMDAHEQQIAQKEERGITASVDDLVHQQLVTGEVVRIADLLTPRQAKIWQELKQALLPGWKVVARPVVGLSWVPAAATDDDIHSHRVVEIECAEPDAIDCGIAVRVWLPNSPRVDALIFRSVAELIKKLSEACNCEYVHASNSYCPSYLPSRGAVPERSRSGLRRL